jgi:hypothetical protein
MTETTFVPPGACRHPCATDAAFQELANWPTLPLSHVSEIVQGFEPRGRGSNKMQSLENYEWAIKAIRNAVANGTLPKRPTPREVLQFCDSKEIPLPESFRRAVMARIPRSSRWQLIGPATEEVILPKRRKGRPKRIQNIAVDSPSSGPYATPKTLAKRHRGERVQGREPDVQHLAKQLAILFVKEKGRMPKAKEIISKLAKQLSRTEGDLHRRFQMKGLLTELEINRARRRYREALQS